MISIQEMMSIQDFMGKPRCRICDSRVCSRPGHCDSFAQIDRAITTCANVCAYVSLEDCLSSDSFRGMDVGQIFLAYRAGELLARKDSNGVQ